MTDGQTEEHDEAYRRFSRPLRRSLKEALDATQSVFCFQGDVILYLEGQDEFGLTPSIIINLYYI